MSWVVVPQDHMTDLCASPLSEGGVVVAGNNDLGIYSKDDMLLTRLDADGATVWAMPAMGRFVTAIDSSTAEVFLISTFKGRVKLGTVEASAPNYDGAFVGAVSLDGAARWGASYSTHEFNRTYDIAAAPGGGAFAAHGAFVDGEISGTAFKNAGGEDALVSRWSDDGKLLWLRTFGWKGRDEPRAVVPREDKGVVVVGTRWKGRSGNFTDRAQDPCQIWVTLLSPDGDTTWEREHGSKGGHALVTGVGANRAGRIVLAGELHGTGTRLGGATFDATKTGFFVATLASDGSIEWIHPRTDPAYPAVDDAGNVFGCSGHGVFLVEQNAEDTWLLRWNDDELSRVECVAGPNRSLFVTGTATNDGKLGEVGVGPPREKRFPTVDDNGPRFVAKLTY